MRIARVVDLSWPVGPGTQVYPGDPEPVFTPVATVDRHGYNLLHVSMGSQTGTHIDAPYHVRDGGLRVDALDLASLMGPAVIIDVRGRPPRTRLTWGDLEPYAQRLVPGTIAVLRTGWDAHYRTAHYFDHPFLDGGAARRLVDLGVRTLAVDAPSPDEAVLDAEIVLEAGTGTAVADIATANIAGEATGGRPGDRCDDRAGADPAGPLPVHHVFAAAGGVIAENLANLDAIDFDPVHLSLLPIRLSGADGAPVRAVAMRLVP